MKKYIRLSALLLSVCLLFCTFSSAVCAVSREESEEVDFTHNSIICWSLCVVLYSKSFSEISEQKDALIPIYLLARDIKESGEYDGEYRNLGELLSDFYSENRAIFGIARRITENNDEILSDSYTELITQDLTFDEKVRTCLYILGFGEENADLISEDGNSPYILSFCRSYIKTLQNSEDYLNTVSAVMDEFNLLLQNLKSKEGGITDGEMAALEKLYYTAGAGATISENTLNDYSKIKTSMLNIGSASLTFCELVSLAEESQTDDELYRYLSAAADRYNYTDKNLLQAAEKFTSYETMLNNYEQKYTALNREIGNPNSLAGSIPIGSGVISSRLGKGEEAVDD